jgi:hypothetical protein
MRKHTYILFPICLILWVGLAACGDDSTPIPVYITPTQAEVALVEPSATPVPLTVTPEPPTATVTPAPTDTAIPAPTNTATLAPSATITPPPTDPPPTANDVLVSMQPTPTTHFGPIIGPDYTPEPLHTALPSAVQERPCPVMVAAPQVTLYTSPDTTSQAAGTAVEREKLTVSQITTDASGAQWANTERGWLLLGPQSATLERMRSCEILLGVQPDTTLMGLHVLNGTSDEAVLRFVQRMLDSGHPLGTIKGLNGTEGLLNEVERISPQTVTVYRSLLVKGIGESDCPRPLYDLETPDPVETARDWMERLKPFWDSVNADFYEYMNECPAPLEWISDFSIEAMRIANEQGRCLLLFSFPGGNPDVDLLDKLFPALQYAVDHPCQPGRTHGIALHAYSPSESELVSESGVWLTQRHRVIYERIQQYLPAAAILPIYITELGQGSGNFLIQLSCDDLARDAMQVT